MNDLQQVNTQYEMKVTKVRVPSGGVFLAGDLYEPVGPVAAAGHSGLVIGHGFSFIKEALVNQGQYFERNGYVYPVHRLPDVWRERRRAARSTVRLACV